jgi:hypothetical protein
MVKKTEAIREKNKKIKQHVSLPDKKPCRQLLLQTSQNKDNRTLKSSSAVNDFTNETIKWTE